MKFLFPILSILPLSLVVAWELDIDDEIYVRDGLSYDEFDDLDIQARWDNANLIPREELDDLLYYERRGLFKSDTKNYEQTIEQDIAWIEKTVATINSRLNVFEAKLNDGQLIDSDFARYGKSYSGLSTSLEDYCKEIKKLGKKVPTLQTRIVAAIQQVDHVTQRHKQVSTRWVHESPAIVKKLQGEKGQRKS